MRRLLTSMLAAAAWLLLLSGAGAVQAAAADDYTGCLTPGGTIIHMAKGASPAKPCSKKQQVIHLDGRVAKQTYELHWNPAVVCEALRLLDVGNTQDIATQLTALGCPSIHVVPPPDGQPLTRVDGNDWVENADGILDAHDCGILKIEKRPEWGGGYQWVVDGGLQYGGTNAPAGGYVAKEVAYDLNGGTEDCRLLCEGDEKCIAATYPAGLLIQGGDSTFRTCRTFHYTDNPGSQPWHQLCGFSETGDFSCSSDTATEVYRWWIRDCNFVPSAP